MLPIAWKTKSGIEAGAWAGRMWESLLERWRVHDFVFANKKGKQAKASMYEPRFFEQLNHVLARHLDIFPKNGQCGG
jgi:hypothetical protein